jgi:tetratricopeptide (TPR) repeat protein
MNNLYGAPGKALGESSGDLGHRVAPVRLGPDGLPLPPDPHLIVRDAGRQANKLFELGVQKEKAGKLAEAEKYYSESLEVRHRIWGDNDPAVVRLYVILGRIELKLKRYDSAETLYKRAFTNALKTFGLGSYELTAYLAPLGDAYYADCKYSDAANYYQQVHEMKRRKLGEDNKETVVAALHLARAWVKANDKMYWTDIDRMAKSNIAVAEKSPDMAQQLIALLDVRSELLTEEGKTDDAAKVTAQADELRAKQQAAAQAAAPAPAPAAAEEQGTKPGAEAAKGPETKAPAAAKGPEVSAPATTQTTAPSTAPPAPAADKNAAKVNAATTAPKQDTKTAPPADADSKTTSPAKKG